MFRLDSKRISGSFSTKQNIEKYQCKFLQRLKKSIYMINRIREILCLQTKCTMFEIESAFFSENWIFGVAWCSALMFFTVRINLSVK